MGQTDTPVQVRRPSAGYFLRHTKGQGCSVEDMEQAPPGSARDEWLAWMYDRERAERWLLRHATPVTPSDDFHKEATNYKVQWTQTPRPGDVQIPLENGLVVNIMAETRWWWEQHGLILWFFLDYGRYSLYQPPASQAMPDYVAAHRENSWWVTTYPSADAPKWVDISTHWRKGSERGVWVPDIVESLRLSSDKTWHRPSAQFLLTYGLPVYSGDGNTWLPKELLRALCWLERYEEWWKHHSGNLTPLLSAAMQNMRAADYDADHQVAAKKIEAQLPLFPDGHIFAQDEGFDSRMHFLLTGSRRLQAAEAVKGVFAGRDRDDLDHLLPKDPPWLHNLYGALRHVRTQLRQKRNTQVAKIAPQLSRPIISPAFRYAGREGLGRISSDQVTFGLYDALIAPKGAWQKTAKGWPIYRPDPDSNQLAFKVTPIIENRNNLDAQRQEMWQIVQELSVSDFDTIAIMMAQVLAEGRADGRAILPADRALDYRGKGQRLDDEGHSAGRQPKMKATFAESVYRVAHLKVSTEGLPILKYNPKGGVTKAEMDINDPVVDLHSNYSQRRDDKTLLWEFSLGRWFTMFREKPNVYTAYLLQAALSYHPLKEQWTKQLAYYLALELRRNADNGQELNQPVSRFIKGARIPCEQRYATKAKDRLEGAFRQVTKDGLIRIVCGNQVIDASSPDIDGWQPEGSTLLQGRNWLGDYLKLHIGIRCDEDTERRYDQEIRKRAAIARARNARKAPTNKRARKQAT